MALFCAQNYELNELSDDRSGAAPRTITTPCTMPPAFTLDFAVDAGVGAGGLRAVNGPRPNFAEGWAVRGVRLFEL